jgi:hypothetical protein
LSLLNEDFDLIGFSYVDDVGVLHESVKLEQIACAKEFDLHYGCGIFECRKR